MSGLRLDRRVGAVTSNFEFNFGNRMASLEHVAQVLRCFCDGRTELGVTEAAQLLHLPKSNLSRLLHAMCDAGLLESTPESRGYRPGVLLHELGDALRRTQSLLARAGISVRRLCDVLGHTGYVTTLSGTRAVGLIHHVGHNPLQVGLPLGRALEVDACATGRSMLAELTDEEVFDLLGGQVSHASPDSPATFEELLERLRRVRQLGYAESQNEAGGRGVGALAVAIRDEYTGQRLSMCLTYAVSAINKADRQHAIELLKQARDQLTRSTS